MFKLQIINKKVNIKFGSDNLPRNCANYGASPGFFINFIHSRSCTFQIRSGQRGQRQGGCVNATKEHLTHPPAACEQSSHDMILGLLKELFITEKICRRVSSNMPARSTGLWLSPIEAPLASGLSIARWLDPLPQRMGFGCNLF